MQETIIAWTDVTWNPTFGCSKVSPGCTFCYAETIALKFGHSKQKWNNANSTGNIQLKPHKLNEPYKLKQPSKIFVNSMSDIFHEEIPDSYISQVFEIMNSLPQHTFQVLTKRTERAANWQGKWTPNIWMGTSVENESVMHRIETLRHSGASTKFLSIEPFLGELPNLDLSGINWAIVGGESGNHMSKHPERWMKHEWARDVRDACLRDNTAFFFKQSSGSRTEMGTELEHEDGSFWRWRQFPNDYVPPARMR